MRIRAYLYSQHLKITNLLMKVKFLLRLFIAATAFYLAVNSLPQLSDAEASYSSLIAVNPTDAETYVSRGNLYYEQGRLDLALADYNKAIAINPNFAEAYSNRGNLYLKQGKFNLAITE